MNTKVLLTAIAGFITMFITNGIMAVAVIGPLFEDRYSSIVADTSSFPLLILGYFIIALSMAALYHRLQPTQNWLSQSFMAGILVGSAIFLGAHTVISGYTTIDATGFCIFRAF